MNKQADKLVFYVLFLFAIFKNNFLAENVVYSYCRYLSKFLSDNKTPAETRLEM